MKEKLFYSITLVKFSRERREPDNRGQWGRSETAVVVECEFL